MLCYYEGGVSYFEYVCLEFYKCGVVLERKIKYGGILVSGRVMR